MKIALIIILVLPAIVAVVWTWYGGFTPLKFEIRELPGEVLVYESYQCDYKHTAHIMDQIYHKLLKEDQIETYRGFGIYYDNPQQVEKSKLRSESGCILENPDEETLNNLKAKYSIKTLPQDKYLVAEFPYKGNLSVFIGILRVYPAFNKHIRNNNIQDEGFIMEIYDVPDKKIQYRKNLN
jgi:DNA gyrase inhibitor GyrI